MAVRERVIAAGADRVNGGAGVRFEAEGHGRMIVASAIRNDGGVPAYANFRAHQVL